MQLNSNCIAIISGAASGIGRQLTWQMAEKKISTYALDNNANCLNETIEKCELNKELITPINIDISNENEVIKFCNEIKQILNNRTIILINNAGVSLFSGHFKDTKIEDIHWLMNINFWGAIYLIKHLYENLLHSPKAYIVNVSSIFGLGGIESNTAYCASKFALKGFTEALRMETKHTNIKTMIVLPGGIDTNIVVNSRLSSSFMTNEMKNITINQFAQRARTKPQKAAALIIKAIEKEKEYLIIGFDGKIFSFITRLFPLGFTSIIKKHIQARFHQHYPKTK